MNFNSNPFRVEYTNGSKAYFKSIPTNAIVAMKDLNSISQISNRNFLAQKNLTIWEYETGEYLNRNENTPTGSTLPLVFIDNDSKPTDIPTISYGFSGATTISGMTFTANNIAANTVFRVTTSATTMANNTFLISGSGVNTTVYFSGASTTTQNLYAALTGSSFSGLGITMTGQGATKINTGGTVTFFISANTTDINSGYVFLQRLV